MTTTFWMISLLCCGSAATKAWSPNATKPSTSNLADATQPTSKDCTPQQSNPPENAQDVTPSYCSQKIYLCKDGFKWLSVGSHRMPVCENGVWSEIKDKCVEEQVTPRNCSEIQDLGMSTNGRYYIFPSGASGGRIEVLCDLSTAGGRWTVVAVGVKEFTPNDSTEWSSDQEGYFIGTTNLVHLTERNGADTSVILEISLENKDGTPIGNVSYSDFHVTDGGTLSSVGTYHGFLGDGLCDYVGTKFNSTTMYWADNIDTNDTISSALFGSNNKWGTYEDIRIVFRIRSRFHDRENACPPAIGWNREWKFTELAFHGDRTEGSIISYNCSGGDLLKEGYDKPLEERTSEGKVTCMKDAMTREHKWFPQVQLPCSLTCPDKFIKSVGETCNHFSERKVNNILEASHGCSQLNSSLHWPSNAAYLHPYPLVGNVNWYYTAWDFRFESDLDSLKATLTGFNQVDLREKRCAIIVPFHQFVNLDAGSCFPRSKRRYICTKPERCPEGFVLPDSKRGCYKWDETEPRTDIFEAAKECNKFASSLPTPVSMNQLKDIVQLAQKLVSDDSKKNGIYGIFLGFFNNAGNWSLFGMYDDIDDAVIGELGDSHLPYRVLKVNSSSKGNYEILPSWGTWSTFALSNLCELHGPTGCAFPMPSADHAQPHRIVRFYDEINTNLPYECDRGFFMAGIPVLTRQTITCYGQLGGWTPDLLPCSKVQVCPEHPFEPYPGMTVVTDNETNYLDGIITYICQSNLTTRNKGVGQIYACQENTSHPNYPEQPMPSGFDFFAFGSYRQELEPCNICNGTPDINGLHIKHPNPTSKYEIGENVTLECQDGYHAALRTKYQTVECLNGGWDTIPIAMCYEACEDDPPAIGVNITMKNITSDRIGSSVMYECKQGFFIEPTENHPDLSTSLTATCDPTHTWKIERNLTEPLDCVRVTHNDPPIPGDGASYNWNTFSRTVGTKVEYNCPPESGGFPDNRKHSLILVATDNGWQPSTSSDQLKCVKVCRGIIPDGSEIKNANTSLVIDSGNSVALECNDGFHVSPKTKFQIINCTAEGLEPRSLLPCYKACVNDPPDLGDTLHVGEITTDAVNSSIVYTCPKGLYLTPTQNHPELSTTVEAICQSDGQWHVQSSRQHPLECAIVIEKPPVPGDTANYDWNGYSRTVGTKVTYNCSDSQIFLYNEESKLVIEATPYGWKPKMTSKMLRCYHVCTEDSLPAPGKNMISDNKTNPKNRIEGTAFNYTCNQGTYLLPSQGYQLNTTLTRAICDGNGEWNFPYPGASLDCFSVCLDDPPEALNANSDWNNITRKIGTNITYECLRDYYFPDFQTNWTITCKDSEWTKVDKEEFTCKKGCLEKAPATIYNANLSGSVDLGREGDILHYICPEGTAFKTGTNKMTIKCVNESWTEGPVNISCESACPGPPPPPGPNGGYNFSGDYTEGQVIKYECDLDSFTDGNQVFYEVCQSLNWTIASVPECRTFLI